MQNITREYIKRQVDDYIQRGYLDSCSLGQEIYACALKYANKTAVIDNEKEITYEELWKSIYVLAKYYTETGLQKKDNVLLQLPNGIDFIVNCFALSLIGVRPVLLLMSHRECDMINISKLAKPKAIITLSTFMGYSYEKLALLVKEEANSIENIILTDKMQDIYLSIEKDDRKEFRNCSSYYDIALFLLSGGTTGTPKLIPKLQCGYVYNAKAAAKHCELNEDTVCLTLLSMAHDYPLCNPGVMGTLFCGGKVITAKTSSCDEAFELIERYKVNFVQLVPAIALLWIETLELEEEYDISCLKKIAIGAAKLEMDLARKLVDYLDCTLLQGYGLGEGVTCFTKCDDDFSIAASCQGTPISNGDKVKIVDEYEEEVEQGMSGELIQKGPYTFFGYYRADHLNKAAFTKDGYFKTGDKAMITPEGNIKILGRVMEQINRAGENVIPSEIETLIRKNTRIKDAAVLGIPDAELGERTCAVLISNEREQKPSKSEICQFLSELGTAQYKLPDQVVYVEAFPMKNIGKIDKNALRIQIMKKTNE